ncbi:hypothetical protein B0H13DRAFT_2426445 [Mycena leptocephala]|nr:hypothetical protein B0H13DRAFT_2426445 [Mycena leptocephala]
MGYMDLSGAFMVPGERLILASQILPSYLVRSPFAEAGSLHTRNAAMQSPYASPRRHRLAANPFQEVGNLLRIQGQTLAELPSLDQERFATRTMSANKHCRKRRANVTVAFRDARSKIGLCRRHRRAVHLCFGAVTRSDNNAGTFTLDPEQWTNAFNDYAKVQATKNSAAAPKAPLKSVFPVIGFFPETTRYKKKPVPWVKQYVSFGGYLSGMASSLEGETMQERFRVEVDNIAFLGTYTPLASTPSPTLTASTSGAYGSSAGSKKAHFSYSKFSQKCRHDDDSSDGPTSSPSPATATTPSA